MKYTRNRRRSRNSRRHSGGRMERRRYITRQERRDPVFQPTEEELFLQQMQQPLQIQQLLQQMQEEQEPQIDLQQEPEVYHSNSPLINVVEYLEELLTEIQENETTTQHMYEFLEEAINAVHTYGITYNFLQTETNTENFTPAHQYIIILIRKIIIRVMENPALNAELIEMIENLTDDINGQIAEHEMQQEYLFENMANDVLEGGKKYRKNKSRKSRKSRK
jgi:hypothetical protein